MQKIYAFIISITIIYMIFKTILMVLKYRLLKRMIKYNLTILALSNELNKVLKTDEGYDLLIN